MEIPISIIALIVAGLSLYWSYRSHYSFPKSVIQARAVIDTSNIASTKIEFIEIINHGPSEAVLTNIIFSTRKPSITSRKNGYWDVSSFCYDVSGGEPISNKRDWARIVRPGHICTVKIDPAKLLRGINGERLPKLLGIGFLDSFDRMHLVDGASFKKIVELGSSVNDQI